jgi:hypothetical protein
MMGFGDINEKIEVKEVLLTKPTPKPKKRLEDWEERDLKMIFKAFISQYKNKSEYRIETVNALIKSLKIEME